MALVSEGSQGARGRGAREVEGEVVRVKMVGEGEERGKTAKEGEEMEESEGMRRESKVGVKGQRERREEEAEVMMMRRRYKEVAVKGRGVADGLSWASPVAQNPETPKNLL